MARKVPAQRRSQLNVRISPEEERALGILARAEERTTSDMVRLLIRRAYDAHKRMVAATRAPIDRTG
jgi:hypothetical protein